MAALPMLSDIAHKKAAEQTNSCGEQMKVLRHSIELYLLEHENTFPNAATWLDDIMPTLPSVKPFVCPAERGGSQRCSYAFNAKLSGLKKDEINSDTVMIFECRDGWNVSGSARDLISRHKNTYVVVFVGLDQMKWIPKSGLSQLRWDP